MARLGEAFPLIRNGASIKQTDGAGGYPITRIETIANREVDRSKFGYADINDLGKYEDYLLHDGDILMSHINSEKHLGKVALYRSSGDEHILHGMNLLMLRADTQIVLPSYAAYFFNSDAFLRQIPNITKKSVNQASFTVTALKELNIPLPSLDAQVESVKKLDMLSNLISLRKQQLAKLDELLKARFVELFGDAKLNPKGYPVKALSEIAEYWNGLTYKPEDVADSGTIVLRSSNIQNAQLDFEDIVRVNCKIGDKKFVQKNDILMCSRNGSARLVGKVALIQGLDEPMSFGAFMMIIRSQYYPYLLTFFQTSAFREQIATGATTTINQITGNMLNKVVLPVPDIETMNEFAAFCKQTDKSKLTIQQSLDKLEILKKSLMQKYFE